MFPVPAGPAACEDPPPPEPPFPPVLSQPGVPNPPPPPPPAEVFGPKLEFEPEPPLCVPQPGCVPPAPTAIG